MCQPYERGLRRDSAKKNCPGTAACEVSLNRLGNFAHSHSAGRLTAKRQRQVARQAVLAKLAEPTGHRHQVKMVKAYVESVRRVT